MTQTPSNPFDYHISTLLQRDERYGVEASRDEFDVIETDEDEMVYILDGETASVVDELGDRDGLYDNAAAFVTGNFDSQDPLVHRIDSSEGNHGFVAIYPDMEQAVSMVEENVMVAQIPAETALIFDADTQYDIKIE